MPAYLNFKRHHNYKHQKSINCKLYLTNGIVLIIIFLDIGTTSFLDNVYIESVKLLPYFV